ncbi:hypothetical protein NZD89_20125 [Alicyclobacillus fastidiosus]|uniref:Nudix hydrolase domain-containing protein n=1 Tax=Alicyclobacillus fastidiosus TaxID=392011 RepID=A0ABY6ZCU2_9BACL|nr:hypothetical protein [Alicyclobacillus fastidiosus]WAH40603.1 hypothetical protein NZD89_20125 [Alicyclobacillus fastidiosus]GMA62041.1 hypothetical protein GCM10025859_24810 [Alicyclobacillus fastidiosus]
MTHVVDHIFLCDVLDEHKIGTGTAPDEDYIGIEWIPVKELCKHRFFPAALIPPIIEVAEGGAVCHGVYTGDIN